MFLSNTCGDLRQCIEVHAKKEHYLDLKAKREVFQMVKQRYFLDSKPPCQIHQKHFSNPAFSAGLMMFQGWQLQSCYQFICQKQLWVQNHTLKEGFQMLKPNVFCRLDDAWWVTTAYMYMKARLSSHMYKRCLLNIRHYMQSKPN